MMHHQRYVMISWNVLMRISVRYFLYRTLSVRYEIYPAHFPFDLRCQSGVCNSCNIDTSNLPDMYAQSPRPEGIHIRQITSAYMLQLICNIALWRAEVSSSQKSQS